MTPQQIEFMIYCYYSRGMLEDEAKELGYKGNVEKAKRCNLEKFIIKKLTKNIK